jgi:hypothetical protein
MGKGVGKIKGGERIKAEAERLRVETGKGEGLGKIKVEKKDGGKGEGLKVVEKGGLGLEVGKVKDREKKERLRVGKRGKDKGGKKRYGWGRTRVRKG